jgi:hypothetical protein
MKYQMASIPLHYTCHPGLDPRSIHIIPCNSLQTTLLQIVVIPAKTGVLSLLL